MAIRWAKSARKHRISHARSGYVARTAETIIRQSAPAGSAVEEDRIVFLGPDTNGVILEVMAVEIEQGLLIIHAMKMRPQYRPFLKRKRNA
ncbi:MAG: hypothetical protein DLM62_09015 [Pseudonocardiales bacterium]|nr:MAG: hypothetical protein DLM62_09015 [Pseudonocardiales bacterium]